MTCRRLGIAAASPMSARRLWAAAFSEGWPSNGFDGRPPPPGSQSARGVPRATVSPAMGAAGKTCSSRPLLKEAPRPSSPPQTPVDQGLTFSRDRREVVLPTLESPAGHGRSLRALRRFTTGPPGLRPICARSFVLGAVVWTVLSPRGGARCRGWRLRGGDRRPTVAGVADRSGSMAATADREPVATTSPTPGSTWRSTARGCPANCEMPFPVRAPRPR